MDKPAIVATARRLQVEAAELCERAADAHTAAVEQRERARTARVRRLITPS
ncbi:hypothetical protein Aab01nite_64280 [Paractinoplanes abujensis]|uniref:Uncharacterized protein n=1 Tax=Paractinoplanes abujensis TaxID=882441 RepID=A0A7W7CTF8_9ACTN|nr:hypothetical protein [Actinoplanes abujensis]MBB4692661.1 hypothetical protein [Actinoplanes abujensis]GID22838.1 hypothetical protein Aab01nite_64280 [Actinoplanes abujensis]